MDLQAEKIELDKMLESPLHIYICRFLHLILP